MLPEWNVREWNVPANAKVMGQVFPPEGVRLSAEPCLGPRCLVQVWILMRGFVEELLPGSRAEGRDVVFGRWRGSEGVDGVEDGF
ncbi:MAG: hypothetical protein ACKPJD_01365, partial [Planctomycetaceae bacterium]